MEAGAGGQVNGIESLAYEDCPLPSLSRIGHRGHGEESLGVGMSRVAQHRLGGADLHNPAQVITATRSVKQGAVAKSWVI
jgi:sulfopyruvate decarboxylase TPP-binding subunit